LSPGSSGPETTKKREILIVSDQRKQSLFIIVYPGKETAEEVYHTLRELEEQDKIDIKTAATLYRTEEGNLLLKRRQRLTLWKDEFDVGSIGLIMAGTRDGKLAGALIDALIGSQRCFKLRDVKAFLDDKLGPDDSGLVILAANADWEAIQNEVGLTGKELTIELTVKAEKQLAEIAADEDITAAVRKHVEIEEENL
jgi:uncharacterized membrane protein